MKIQPGFAHVRQHKCWCCGKMVSEKDMSTDNMCTGCYEGPCRTCGSSLCFGNFNGYCDKGALIEKKLYGNERRELHV